MFDYDWFFGTAYQQQKRDALIRVGLKKSPGKDRATALQEDDFKSLLDKLECHTLIYLRDGFSYDLKALASDVESRSHLTFECEPGDEPYKNGAFVVAVPFEEICRVEVYAVHPDDKPENQPLITGFKHSPRDEIRG